jgi:hypothetical protein
MAYQMIRLALKPDAAYDQDWVDVELQLDAEKGVLCHVCGMHVNQGHGSAVR